MRQGHAAFAVVALWVGMTGVVVAEPIWDTGIMMDGELEYKEIVLAISLEGPSTDTMTCNPWDSDHWIDPHQSLGQDEGDDPDTWAGWAESKCWWSTGGGTVTQGDWTTTWTAPADQGGEFPLSCAIEDLPKACTRGTRDDARAYAGTG